MCQGMFTSRLIYCIQLFGNVWGIPSLDDDNRRSSSFSKEDNRKLQVLQNRMLRLKTKLGRDTPTSLLLSSAGDLSVHQQSAFHTLMLVYKVVTTKYPRYLAAKLKLRKPTDGQIFNPRQLNTIYVPNVKLNATKSSFLVRGASLWNMLPLEMRSEMKASTYKRELRKWTKENITIKPPWGREKSII